MKRTSLQRNIIILTFLGGLFSLVWFGSSKTLTPRQKQKETWITVFVHGIMSIQPHLSPGNFLRFLRDDVENTTYSKTVELMRKDPHFYKNQAMQNFGLIKIDPFDQKPGNSSSGIARIYDEVTKLTIPDRKFDNHYYTFGWSGLLSPKSRYKDAKSLYFYLQKEIDQFKQRGITPKVRIVGYSHGGNVILNLASVRQKEHVNKKFAIDETIFIGVPVQNETDYMINDPVFKKIYHIYSLGDHVQKLDFFSFHRFFSGRIFKSRHGFKLPDKLTQIQIKFTKPINKATDNKKKISHTFNLNNSAIISGKSGLLREVSPGHAEIWFFGWTPQNYRKNFPLYPLPVIVFAPYIINTLSNVKDVISKKESVIFDIRPHHEIALVKQIKKNKLHKSFNFFKQETIARLNNIAFNYQPKSYTKEEYKKRIHTAHKKARKWNMRHKYSRRGQWRKRRAQYKVATKARENYLAANF